ncbi:MAG: hypothetical protein A2428_10320 [Bdellovibrionales bacterium RIFOXYC1_FULL_54_43]|nr:MAG: hypothetical protein A2428_10320 [Bdellovibrionales bacterium RIFOXYC1_FULL_54_43]OFZ80381.1 MAG: hypothetical protein A2603_13445 [Bdellovibrionales bacterium RIFOXYD1_FULL_55_31]
MTSWWWWKFEKSFKWYWSLTESWSMAATNSCNASRLGDDSSERELVVIPMFIILLRPCDNILLNDSPALQLPVFAHLLPPECR